MPSCTWHLRASVKKQEDQILFMLMELLSLGLDLLARGIFVYQAKKNRSTSCGVAERPSKAGNSCVNHS